MYLNIKEHRCKRVKLATFALTFLILGSLAFLMPTVQTQDPPSPPTPVPVNQTVPLEGNMTFTFYPDESIKMKVIGGIEQAIEPYSAPPPVYNAYINLASSPSGVNLTDVTGTFVLKLNPMYSMLLAALELDIEAHAKGLSSNTTILFNMPGYLGVNGTTGAFTDESTGENNLDFDLTITIWYSLFPEEEIQGFIQTFPTLESQIVTQISELMEGNVTLQDLTYSGETGFASAAITIAGSLVGDFVKGGNALSTNLLPLLGINDTETAPWISPEDLMYTKAKSADMHIRYDRNEFAFLMDSEGVIEGDLDRQINIMKDIYLEQLLQLPDTPPEWALMINDVLLPTNISRKNLGMTLEYLFDGENIKLDFVVDGLVFRPPTTEAFLTFLDKALAGGSAPGFSLIFEGGSDEEGFVEIEVSPTTSEPVIAEPRKVVWIIDNLTNLNLVSFKVIEWPTLSKLTITPEEIEVEEGKLVTVSLDVMNPNNRSITYEVAILVEGIGCMGTQIEDLILFVDVELEAYESKTVQHTIIPDMAGDYNVTVNRMTGSFMVAHAPLPANFVVLNLSASPDEVEEGENVTFGVRIMNDGGTEGTYTVEFKVRRLDRQTLWDQETIDIQNVTIAADTSHHVRAYYEAMSPGTYEVSVGHVTETFMVLSKPLKFAEFVLSNFNYTSGLQEGEPLRIYVDIANVGELAGETTIVIKIDGAIPLAPQSLQSLFQLGPEEVFSQVWTSYQPFEVGTHTIHLDGFEGTFNVIAEPVPFWKSPEFIMAVIVIIIGIIAIYIWRRWGFENIEHIQPPFLILTFKRRCTRAV